MTKELMAVSPRELARLQEALDVLKRAYGLSDEDVDSFFLLLKESKGLLATVKGNTEDIASLSQRLGETLDEKTKERRKKAVEWLNEMPEGYRNV